MVTPTDFNAAPRFQWGVVLAGAVVACAISVVLMQFGAAIGLTDEAPLRGDGFGPLASGGVIAAGIWVLWVQLLSSIVGGYMGGYLRTPTSTLSEHENEVRDGFYGLAIWATATIGVFIVVAVASFLSTYIAIATDNYTAPGDISDREQNATIIYAFIGGATSLLSIAASWWAATMGGHHRTKAVDLTHHLSFK